MSGTQIELSFAVGDRVRYFDLDDHRVIKGKVRSIEVIVGIDTDGGAFERVPREAVEQLKKCDSTFTLPGEVVLCCEVESTRYHQHTARYRTAWITWR